MRGVLVALLLASSFLAGCSDPAPQASLAEIVVESAPPEEIASNATPSYTPSAKTKGHIAGVVVDQAIHPLEGATVKLPGMDLTEVTDRNGGFGFVDLHPGPYFITVELEGYYGAEAVLEVTEDKFTRAKVILEAIPPPAPRHETQQFEGYAQLGTGPGIIFTPSCTCNFNFYLDPVGLQAVVVEATMSAYGGAPTGDNSFYHAFQNYDRRQTHSSGTQANPLRVEARESLATNTDSHYSLRVTPQGFPTPELNKKFQVFVTAFYNELPPVGWSFVAGDP